MNTDNYKIEKGVPIPNDGRGNRGKWSELVKQMEVGDSVLVNSRLEVMNLRNAMVRAGFGCVVRGTDTKQPRVWLVEKK